MHRLLPIISLILLTLLSFARPAVGDLPELNEGAYGGMTPDREYRLGRAWARSLRGQAKQLPDPVTGQYLESLVWKLAAQSELTDHRLEIFVLDNPAFNAFAVPGGVIGLHSGLLLAAQTEGELASVLAHELAHLSQRHFAAQLEEQRRNQPFMVAALLASLLVAAADGEAGGAALSSTLAASQRAQLAFSRQNEREADRIGMQNLVAAGYPADAMPAMFGRLLEAYRFASRPPEFLTTHPVTEARIADSAGRAAQLGRSRGTISGDSLSFSLVKPRVVAYHSDNPEQLLARLQGQLKESNQPQQRQQLLYSVFTTAVTARRFEQANQAYQQLNDSMKTHWLIRLTRAEQALAERRHEAALSELEQLRKLYPDHYPIEQRYAEALHQAGHSRPALQTYRALALKRPTDSLIHYQLAEMYGLADDRIGVHQARTEYFLLTGNVDRALRQIKFALREPGLSDSDRALLQRLEQEAKQVREDMELDY
ncbi:M48 family metalloprotease [Marinobacterium arenosum]|uniref:M48 family metalloprotease n=1 Tax=Marinobacterium arenosum TaxID=2862496 RepID=UPI001C950AEC|nr:M48 family metalloprotease [Marinobacterium arenosum]MBY4677825.1 M48 family metalloprotease [Marinobacterium arenosum]